jgi:DNA-binding response OmpR family regulator
MPQVRILVCDDDAHILHVVATKLRNGGFEVITAADGEEAWEAIVDNAPQLIITDYQMPGLSGLEICAKLRAHPELRQVPVILLTARGYTLDDAKLRESKISGVMVKPFSPRDLLRNVREILDGSKAPSPQTMAVASGPVQK